MCKLGIHNKILIELNELEQEAVELYLYQVQIAKATSESFRRGRVIVDQFRVEVPKSAHRCTRCGQFKIENPKQYIKMVL